MKIEAGALQKIWENIRNDQPSVAVISMLISGVTLTGGVIGGIVSIVKAQIKTHSSPEAKLKRAWKLLKKDDPESIEKAKRLVSEILRDHYEKPVVAKTYAGKAYAYLIPAI